MSPRLPRFRRALELQPNNAEARLYCGYILRRRGDWGGSLAEMAKAEELDPHAASIPANVAGTYMNLRQWNDAKRAASRALALAPNNFTARWVLLLGCVNGDGRIDAARRVIGPLQPGVRNSNNMTRGNVTAIIGEIDYLHILERDFAGALKQVWRRWRQ